MELGLQRLLRLLKYGACVTMVKIHGRMVHNLFGLEAIKLETVMLINYRYEKSDILLQTFSHFHVIFWF